MPKSQDIVLLLKILAHQDDLLWSEDQKYNQLYISSENIQKTKEVWSQNKLATHLCISASEVNAGMKRLNQAGLLVPGLDKKLSFLPVIAACEEYLISAVKYEFPVQLGEYTRGIVTSYAASIFKDYIIIGNDPIPVWPYAQGTSQGLALKPLYPSVPEAITKYPDEEFYNLLVLIDAIRQGRARERNLAEKFLREKIKYEQ